jgi:hypothetical protein
MDGKEFIDAVAALVREYRARCFWFMSEDFSPETVQSAVRALSYLERYGDKNAFIKVVELKKWLSHNYSTISAE